MARTQSTSSPEEDKQNVVETSRSISEVTASWGTITEITFTKEIINFTFSCLFLNHQFLFCWNVRERKNKSPVEVSFPVHGSAKKISEFSQNDVVTLFGKSG